MDNINIKSYRVAKFECTNNLPDNTPVELNCNASGNMHTNDENNTANGELTTIIKNVGNDEFFSIELIISVTFDYSSGTDMKKLFIDFCDKTYDIARQYVNSFLGVMSLPPLVLPNMVFDEDKINITT